MRAAKSPAAKDLDWLLAETLKPSADVPLLAILQSFSI